MKPTPPSPAPSPGPPGLATESTDVGDWLFRWRSYPPLVILAYVVGAVALDPDPAGGGAWHSAWVGVGMALGALGLLVRAATVGFVPMGTSGRGTKELRAETLNTTGMYSVVRHPLYLGNYFLWMGVVVTAGKPMAVLVTTLAFWLYYERIMMAEERFLFGRFGDAFAAWARVTPAFLPRLSGWTPSPHPLSIRFCLGRDYPALYAFVAATTVVEVARRAASGLGWLPGAAWQAWFVGGTAVYLVLHVLKRRTRLLEVSDR